MKNYLRTHAWQLGMAVLVLAATALGVMPHDAMAGAGAVMLVGSTSIPAHFVQQWDKSIRAQAQQRESRLMKAVTDRGTITGDGFTINNLGTTELDENTVRHGDTEWGDPDHSNRLVGMKDFYKALPLDRNDIPKMLANPVTGGDYMRMLMAAKNRKIDQVIFNAILNPILSKDGATTYSLPAGQKIAVGGTGFTKAKIIQARSIFRANECDDEADDQEELFITWDELMLQQLLSDTQLTSADYMTVQAIQRGKFGETWMGFNWIPYQGTLRNAGVRTTAAWAKSGVHYGVGYEEGNVTRRGDKKDLYQVSMGASYGAGRQDELKVVQIDYQ